MSSLRHRLPHAITDELDPETPDVPAAADPPEGPETEAGSIPVKRPGAIVSTEDPVEMASWWPWRST